MLFCIIWNQGRSSARGLGRVRSLTSWLCRIGSAEFSLFRFQFLDSDGRIAREEIEKNAYHLPRLGRIKNVRKSAMNQDLQQLALMEHAGRSRVRLTPLDVRFCGAEG